MATNLRVSETWYNRALWAVAIFLAYFLTGLGGAVIRDLPQIETQRSVESFITDPAYGEKGLKLEELKGEQERLSSKINSSLLNLNAAQNKYDSLRKDFDARIETRNATGQADQDEGLIIHAKSLESLQASVRQAKSEHDELSARIDSINRQITEIERKRNDSYAAAEKKFNTNQEIKEFRVFGYRLAFIFPMLALAGYVFVRYRNATYWPFAWGFILFALNAFLFELVPYLPSYGGYVRYTIGVLLTLLLGSYAMREFRRYLTRQKEIESQPIIDSDKAILAIRRGVCPRCERSIDRNLDNFCPHCGVELHFNCKKCQVRRISFSRFCFGCGDSSSN